MKNLFTIYLTIFSFFLSGCSILMTESRYYPLPNDNIFKTESSSMVAHRFFDSSPNEEAIIEKPQIEINIRNINQKDLVIALGPWLLPVIPIFPFQLLSEAIFPNKNNSILMRIWIYNKKGNPLNWDLEKVLLTLSDGKQVKPIDYRKHQSPLSDLDWNKAEKTNKVITINESSIIHNIYLLYPVSIKDVKKFVLKLDGLSDSTEISLPNIEFEWNGGSLMAMGP
ncbi:MAG: hypothetical protein JSV34_00725 [Candidatus Omnitrophota bacterium]|nr:MAG: hypothetical protein JSV34_00725 [Candidatus Omnitrophota bacterium]